MKKKTLLLTTLAGSMLIAGMAMPTTKAVTNTTAIVNEDKEIVAVELANSDTQLSKDQLKTLIAKAYEGKNLRPEITVEGDVKTGSTVKVGENKTLTVVVYGDVNGDGAVNSKDAVAIAKHSTGAETLEGAALIAAGLDNNTDNINSKDAVKVAKFSTGALEESLVKSGVKIEEKINPEQEVQDHNYTIAVNGNNIINNENKTAGTVTIDLEKSSDTDIKGLKLSYFVKDPDTGKLKTKATTVSVPTIAKYNTHVEIKDNSNVTVSGKINFDFENMPEGKNVIQLVDSTGKVLAETTVTKDTLTIPEAVEVKTTREDTSKASMSFIAKEGSDITKMYYVVVPVDQDVALAMTYSKITAEIKKANENKALTANVLAAGEVAITNNTFNGTIATNLVNNTAYRVIYVVENSLGNRFYGKDVKSNKPVTTKATIAKDVYGTNAEKEVKNITLPDLENEKPANANFEWTMKNGEVASNKTFVVDVLNEEGKVLNEVEISNKSTASLTELGITTPGTYKIKVTVKGKDDGTTSASESVESKTITIDSYEAVKNIEFVNEDNKKTLTWESDYTIINEEGEGDIAGYIVDLYEYNTKTNEYELVNTDTNLDGIEEKEVDLSTYITANKLYKAEVRVQANPNQSAKLTSEVGESKEFFVLTGTAISVSKDENKKDKITTNSVTLKATKAVVGNKEVSYDLRVWKKNTNTGDFDGARYAEVTNKYMSNVQLGETSEVEVTGLEEGATYRFELIVKVDSAEASRTTGDITLLKSPIEIKGLVVSETPGEGKIANSASTGININGVEVKSADFGKYANSAELTVVSSLLQDTTSLVYGDKITLDEDKLTVELQAQASASSNAERDFGNKLEGMTVELKGNTSDKIIKTTANTKGPKEIILSEGSNFDISGVTAEKITLENNVSVKTGTNKVTVADGATVTINGVIVTAKNTELTLKSDAQGTKNFTVDPTGNGVNADITFENTTTDAVTINFVGEGDLSGRQQGYITIRSASGKVTLSSQNFNIESKIDVVVEKGDVDISSKFLTGDKTVSVKSADSKNTAKVTIEGPEVPSDIASVKIISYALSDRSESSLTSYFNNQSNVSKNIDKTVSLSDAKAVKEYFDSFKDFFGKGATLSKEANSKTVTITFTKAVDEAIDISNLTK